MCCDCRQSSENVMRSAADGPSLSAQLAKGKGRRWISTKATNVNIASLKLAMTISMLARMGLVSSGLLANPCIQLPIPPPLLPPTLSPSDVFLNGPSGVLGVALIFRTHSHHYRPHTGNSLPHGYPHITAPWWHWWAEWCYSRRKTGRPRAAGVCAF